MSGLPHSKMFSELVYIKAIQVSSSIRQTVGLILGCFSRPRAFFKPVLLHRTSLKEKHSG
jgi:hypothetical protein